MIDAASLIAAGPGAGTATPCGMLMPPADAAAAAEPGSAPAAFQALLAERTARPDGSDDEATAADAAIAQALLRDIPIPDDAAPPPAADAEAVGRMAEAAKRMQRLLPRGDADAVPQAALPLPRGTAEGIDEAAIDDPLAEAVADRVVATDAAARKDDAGAAALLAAAALAANPASLAAVRPQAATDAASATAAASVAVGAGPSTQRRGLADAAALQAPIAPDPAASDTAPADGPPQAAADATTPRRNGGDNRPALRSAGRAEAKPVEPDATPGAAGGTAASAATFALRTEPLPAAVDAAPRSSTGSDNTAAPLPAWRAGGDGALRPAAAGTAAEAAPPFHAQLSAALDSPAFGSALSLQISTLVAGEISQARLHLHPAELGPIAVQIGLEGQQAQVHLAVEHAATRSALEQALPELARALQDAGFTMTGGGVFQQPRQPDGAPDTGAAPQRSGTAPEAPGDMRAAPQRATRGLLDVYA